MEIQFCKLGLVSPEGEIPSNIKNTFQILWANNGDAISKQYAGTNALKVCNFVIALEGIKFTLIYRGITPEQANANLRAL